jgi:hypothetical protein
MMPVGFEPRIGALFYSPLRLKCPVRKRPWPIFAGCTGIRFYAFVRRRGYSAEDAQDRRRVSFSVCLNTSRYDKWPLKKGNSVRFFCGH